jgi:hypothetical protein
VHLSAPFSTDAGKEGWTVPRPHAYDAFRLTLRFYRANPSSRSSVRVSQGAELGSVAAVL